MSATHRHGAAAAAIVIALGAWGVGAHAAAAEYPPEIPKDLPPISPGPTGPGPSVTPPESPPDQVPGPTEDSGGTGGRKSADGPGHLPPDPHDPDFPTVAGGIPGFVSPYSQAPLAIVTASLSAKKRAAPNTLANPVSERPSRTGADGIGLLLALGVVAVGAGTGMAVSSARSRRSSAAGQ